MKLSDSALQESSVGLAVVFGEVHWRSDVEIVLEPGNVEEDRLTGLDADIRA